MSSNGKDFQDYQEEAAFHRAALAEQQHWEKIQREKQVQSNLAQGYLDAVNRAQGMAQGYPNTSSMLTSTYRNGVLVGANPTHILRDNPRVSDIQLRNKDLENPLFDTPLPTLSVMWQVRFGLGWVTERQIMAAVQEPGSEWGLLFSRLNARNVFERHTLYDTGENVFRLIQES